MTTLFPPNTAVTCTSGGGAYDIDFVTSAEGASTTLVTYAAMTSRSYHQGIVNAALMDGSVRAFVDATDASLWQALSTRGGNETINLDSY